jgi:hypothetical protein
MKDELQGKLVEILTSIQTAAGKASDFAMDQLPDIAQSYIVYGRVSTVATSAFLLLASAALFAMARWAYKNPWNASPYSFDQDKKRSDSNVLAIVLPALAGSFLMLVAALSFNWLVWFAPKVWLLKELASLIK